MGCGCAQTSTAPAPLAAVAPSPAASALSAPALSASPPPDTAPTARTEAPAEESHETSERSDEVRWRKRSKACPPGQALDEVQNRSLDYFHASPFSVIRVSPADTLNLRSSSSPNAESLAQLDFQQAGLRWTGSACNVRGALWFELEWGGLRGWVNGLYAQPTAKTRDDTERVKPWLGTAKPKSFARFVEHLRRSVAQHEALAGPDTSEWCGVKTVGSQVDGSRARIVLFVECAGNDSIAGTQLLVTATQDATGWSIANVECREICLRGAEESCI